MTIRKLPAAPAAQSRPGVSCELSPSALERWKPEIHAAADGDASTISIFDPIGYDSWSGDGVTAKRIGAALRSIGEGDVTVRVNSPGGDMFEGLAIYNLLREHKGKVTVQVLGLAASASSIIAMAADELQMARAGFLMIHNAWVLAAGNRNDLREIADTLETFDSAMAGIYAARTGEDVKAMQALMDKETWIGGSAAIDQGFADALLAADDIAETDSERSTAKNATRQVEVLLARQGLPRSERRRLIQEIKASTPGAADHGTPGAADAGLSAEAPAALIRAFTRFELSAALSH